MSSDPKKPTKKQIKSDPQLLNWNRYNTRLTPGQKKRFKKWTKEQGNLWDRGAYDTQGFWKETIDKGVDVRDEDNHGPDTYKKPNHPTFSNQSKYAGKQKNEGGAWIEDGPNVDPRKVGGYYPSEATKKLYGGKQFYDWFFGREPGRIEHYGPTEEKDVSLPTNPNNMKKVPQKAFGDQLNQPTAKGMDTNLPGQQPGAGEDMQQQQMLYDPMVGGGASFAHGGLINDNVLAAQYPREYEMFKQEMAFAYGGKIPQHGFGQWLGENATAIGTVVGGVGGFLVGGPAGAKLGAKAGGSLGGVAEAAYGASQNKEEAAAPQAPQAQPQLSAEEAKTKYNLCECDDVRDEAVAPAFAYGGGVPTFKLGGSCAKCGGSKKVYATGGMIEQADYEVEGDEVIQGKGMQVFGPGGNLDYVSEEGAVIRGNDHGPDSSDPNSGVKMASSGATEGRVFSKRLKDPDTGKKFSSEAERLLKKIGKYEETINNNASEPIAKKTAQIMSDKYHTELDALFTRQEELKQAEGIPTQPERKQEALDQAIAQEQGSLPDPAAGPGAMTTPAPPEAMPMSAFGGYLPDFKNRTYVDIQGNTNTVRGKKAQLHMNKVGKGFEGFAAGGKLPSTLVSNQPSYADIEAMENYKDTITKRFAIGGTTPTTPIVPTEEAREETVDVVVDEKALSEAILGNIGEHESGAAGINARARYKQEFPDISTNTISENEKKYKNNALGQWQIQAKTARDVLSKAGYSKKEIDDYKFDYDGQKRIAEMLLERRGLKKYAQGKITPEEFGLSLSQEWAYMPKDTSGTTFYSVKDSLGNEIGDNQALITYEDQQNLINLDQYKVPKAEIERRERAEKEEAEQAMELQRREEERKRNELKMMQDAATIQATPDNTDTASRQQRMYDMIFQDTFAYGGYQPTSGKYQNRLSDLYGSGEQHARMHPLEKKKKEKMSDYGLEDAAAHARKFDIDLYNVDPMQKEETIMDTTDINKDKEVNLSGASNWMNMAKGGKLYPSDVYARGGKLAPSVTEHLESGSSEAKSDPLGFMDMMAMGGFLPQHKSGIHIKPENRGNLHKWAGIPEGEPIPMSKKIEAKNSSDPRVAKMGNFAVNAAGWKKAFGGHLPQHNAGVFIGAAASAPTMIYDFIQGNKPPHEWEALPHAQKQQVLDALKAQGKTIQDMTKNWKKDSAYARDVYKNLEDMDISQARADIKSITGTQLGNLRGTTGSRGELMANSMNIGNQMNQQLGKVEADKSLFDQNVRLKQAQGLTNLGQIDAGLMGQQAGLLGQQAQAYNMFGQQERDYNQYLAELNKGEQDLRDMQTRSALAGMGNMFADFGSAAIGRDLSSMG